MTSLSFFFLSNKNRVWFFSFKKITFHWLVDWLWVTARVWRSENNLGSQFFTPTMCALGVEFGSSGSSRHFYLVSYLASQSLIAFSFYYPRKGKNTNTYTKTHINMHTHDIYVDTYTHICRYTHTCTYIHKHIYVHTYIQTHICTHTFTYTHIHVYAHTYTWVYTHIHNTYMFWILHLFCICALNFPGNVSLLTFHHFVLCVYCVLLASNSL